MTESSSVQNFLPYTDCNASPGSTLHRLNIIYIYIVKYIYLKYILKFTKIEK